MLLGAAAHFVGLHPIVGAFAGGVVAGESGRTQKLLDEVYKHKRQIKKL